MLGALVILALHAVLYFFFWWFRREHVGIPVLFALLSAAMLYGVGRMLVGWYNVLFIAQPAWIAPSPAAVTAIFITATPGEPAAMFDETLAAAACITSPHTTYLLDDTRDPEIARIAERHGAVRLELIGLPGAKAGKINAALALTNEEFILVLDPDHVPHPEFLERVLGQFHDEGIGFVQVAQAYGNSERSFVAGAAAEQTYAFYGPTLQGMYGLGTSVVIGANGTFRRSALASIGGHGLGLAEDLITAIRLHAAGWRSVYVPEIVSYGRVPEDLGSFAQQQLKWSRGVWEMLLTEYPRAFSRLTPLQRLSYFMIGTYYAFGLTTAIYLAIPLLYLSFGWLPASVGPAEYLQHAAPLGLFGIFIYLFSERFLCDPTRERGFHLRGFLLKLGLWPVYLKGTLLAFLRIDVPYIATAKEARTGSFWRLARVQLIGITATLGLAANMIHERLYQLPESHVRLTTGVAWGMLSFALIHAAFASSVIYAAWRATRVKPRQAEGMTVR
ncbi:MAG: glycosyltransferase family 2 protein [Thermoanaerobaculia bacterium]